MSDFFMSFEIQSIVKLFLGFALSAIIGFQRESLNKPAGFKTHCLIGVSSVLIMKRRKHKKKLQICYGISQSYISRLEKKIMNKMKKDILSKTG